GQLATLVLIERGQELIDVLLGQIVWRGEPQSRWLAAADPDLVLLPDPRLEILPHDRRNIHGRDRAPERGIGRGPRLGAALHHLAMDIVAQLAMPCFDAVDPDRARELDRGLETPERRDV